MRAACITLSHYQRTYEEVRSEDMNKLFGNLIVCLAFLTAAIVIQVARATGGGRPY